MVEAQPEIPGFTLLEPAGRGGMGTVYVAEQHSPRRTIALKVLSRPPSAETLAEFRREAAVIAGLEHPRIVPLYGYGEHNGLPYLVMRYLSGGSLVDRIPMDLAAAKGWLEAIAAALDFAHDRGLVHRDVKPSNILLDEQGNAYLSDFGIAGTVADAASGRPTGSAAYMPPEQSRGEGIDRRSDIYSLAVTLFETLTGKQPYTAETALGVIARHMHDPVPLARDLEPSVPPAVDLVLELGMAKDPQRRPATGGEFAELVGRAIRSPEVAETVAEPGVRSRRRVGWVAGLVALGLAGIALIGGGALLGVLVPQEEAPRPTATLPASAAPVGDLASDVSNGELLFDHFSIASSGFAVLSDQDGGVEYADGALRFTVLTDGTRWYSPSGRVDEQDVVIEVTARLVSGPALSEMALLCRWRDLENFTALAVRDDASAAIWRDREGDTDMLQDWAPGFSGFSDEPVQLRAICRGEELRLEVAGVTVAHAIDPDPLSGDIALMAGLGELGELVVLFDDVRVSR